MAWTIIFSSTLAGSYLGITYSSILCGLSILLLSALCVWEPRRYERGYYVVIIGIACFCVSSLRTQCDLGPQEPLLAANATNVNLWRVRLTSFVELVTSDAQARWRVRADLLEQNVAGLWKTQKGSVVLDLWPGSQVAFGDELELLLEVSRLCAPRNVTDWTPLQIRQRRRISAYARVKSAHMLVTSTGGARAWLDRQRQRRTLQIERWSPNLALAALAKAIFLGQSHSLTELDRNIWADAGIAHLLAISGLHISWLRDLCRRLCLPLLYASVQLTTRYGAWSWAWIAAEGVGLFYTLLTGCSWGALRATLMGMIQLIAHLCGRAPRLWNAWCVSGTCLLVGYPHAGWDVGFLLSFAAVAGLIGLGATQTGLQTEWPISWLRTLQHRIQHACASCVYALVATLGICAIYFGQIPGTSAVVNLLAVPWTAYVVLPLGFIHLALAEHTPCWLFSAWMDALALLHKMAALGQRFYGATLYTPAIEIEHLVLYAGMLVLLWQWQARTLCRRWQSASGFAIVCTLLVYDLRCSKPWWRSASVNELRIEHIYVGQGDATLVQFPKGMTMLVDGGGRIFGQGKDPGQTMLAPVLRYRGIRRIDLMVVSHPHPDHIQGLLAIAKRWPVDELWLNGDGLNWAHVRDLIRLVQRSGGQIRRPYGRYLRQGVVIDVFAPLAGTMASANDHSLVLRLQYQKRSVLLAGDIEHRAEAALAHVLPATDILKVAHHGSRTSSHRAFLAACKPRLAILSYGDHNPFGHPHTQTLERLHAAHIPTWHLARDGALLLRTDGQSWRHQASYKMQKP